MMDNTIIISIIGAAFGSTVIATVIGVIFNRKLYNAKIMQVEEEIMSKIKENHREDKKEFIDKANRLNEVLSHLKTLQLHS